MKTALAGALFTLGLAGFALAQEDLSDEAQQPIVAGDDAVEAETLAEAEAEATEYVDPLADYVCEDPKYEIYLFSRSPLVIYIKDFVSAWEREHLLKISNGTFARSGVASAEGDTISDHRTSSSTTPSPDAVTNCIASRARRFQGLDKPLSHMEPIQLVKYAVGEQYHAHTDWFPPESTGEKGHAGVPRGGNRVSSFFAYVEASDDIAGGGTNFPKLAVPKGDGWCQFVECDDDRRKGVTFRAVAGNAVYWENLIPTEDGRVKGDDRVLHAGLPVLKGTKMGMNIWTKEIDYN